MLKMKKKTALVASFTVGAMLFATTALADITSKSGYEQLKDSVKVTAEKASKEFDSVTLDATFVIKDNGKVLESENSITKYDRKKNATESINSSERNGKKTSYYTYADDKTNINKSADNKYYVTEFTEKRDINQFQNPFEEDEAQDVERIADAIVGNLKDHVVSKDNPDGSKELSGALSEMQIPALVNAVASFTVKQGFNQVDMSNSKPILTKDIYVKEVTGQASVDKDGVLEDILGTATITGKDAQGQAHDITIEILAKVQDINATKVTKPDLSGKDVIKEVAKPYNNGEISNPEKFVGSYKNDIVIEKDGKFVKAGERFLEITKIDDKGISGRYHQEVKAGFESMTNKINDFSFDATFDKDNFNRSGRFQATSENGPQGEGYIYLDEYSGRVDFHFNQPYSGGSMFDSSFRLVLE